MTSIDRNIVAYGYAYGYTIEYSIAIGIGLSVRQNWEAQQIHKPCYQEYCIERFLFE